MMIFIIQALLDYQVKSTFQMPSRGRKRFVSEGDGGLVKETSWSVLSSCWLSLNFGTRSPHVYTNFRWWESWERKGVDSSSATFIRRAKPMFTSDPRRSEGAVFKSGIAFTSCLHLKMVLFPIQGWLESLCCHWTCEHFRLFCERSRKSCFSWFRALQLLQNWNKLWSDQIWFWILLHTHKIVYILVIVHRILKVYQNWSEFIITHEWSCEKKLYLEIIKTNVVYSAAQKSKIGISAHISELYTRQCLVPMVKIRRETILENDIRTCVLYMSENWKYSSVPT